MRAGRYVRRRCSRLVNGAVAPLRVFTPSPFFLQNGMSSEPHVFVFPPLPASTLPASIFGTGAEQGRTLAQVVAENVGAWTGPAAVVLRPEAESQLAVVGWFTPAEQQQLRAAADDFLHSLPRLRYVSYTQAEADCAVLADRLRATLSPEERAAARFVGIPRGGLIVLGMLGYELELTPDQFGVRGPTDGPLVVVDDCFLTGSRVARFLEEIAPQEAVVLASLYAPPDLCAALERDHPAVRACVHARSLPDHAPALYGDDYPAWRTRWANRDTGPRYWHGVTDHLCFAWSEPDRGLWNETTQVTDRAWSLVPSRRCLKTRSGSTAAVPVHVQAAPSGPLRPGPDVVYANLGDHTLVAHTEQGTVLVLDDTAAAFWHALVEHGTVSAAYAALAATYDPVPDTLATDLENVAETLAAHHLLDGLVPSPSPVA